MITIDAPKKDRSVDLFNNFKGSTSQAAQKPMQGPVAQQPANKPQLRPAQAAYTPQQRVSSPHVASGAVQQPANRPAVIQQQRAASSNTPRGAVHQPAGNPQPKPNAPLAPTSLGREKTASGSKVTYVCKKCGYKYSLDPTVHAKTNCPWCGAPVEED